MDIEINLSNVVNYLNRRANTWYFVDYYTIQFFELVELKVRFYENEYMSDKDASKIARDIKKEIKENLGLFMKDIPKKLKVRISDVWVWDRTVAYIQIGFGDDVMHIVDVKLGHE